MHPAVILDKSLHLSGPVLLHLDSGANNVSYFVRPGMLHELRSIKYSEWVLHMLSLVSSLFGKGRGRSHTQGSINPDTKAHRPDPTQQPRLQASRHKALEDSAQQYCVFPPLGM